jgi:hypothetical protein
MAVTEENKTVDDWSKPNAIVTDAYKSLDKQIEQLELIPGKAKQACTSLMNHVIKEDLFSLDGQIKTYAVLQDIDEEIGHCIDAVLEVEHERASPQREAVNMNHLSLPSFDSMQTLQVNNPQQGQMSPPITVKTGFLSELAKGRAINKALDKALQFQREMMNRPEITTSKVKEVIDYCKELIPEFNKLFNFYDCAIKHVSFYDDSETIWNQRREIVNEVAKITGIIRDISRAVSEYRKDRFGDRKVAVATGMMYVAAAQAAATGVSVTGGREIFATSKGETSQTYKFRKPDGGPYPPIMSSGVEEKK